MVVNGHIENGKIILDDNTPLPEGVQVRVEVLDNGAEEDCGVTDEPRRSIAERYKNVIGKAEGLPPDASVNLDHYLYGHPKK